MHRKKIIFIIIVLLLTIIIMACKSKDKEIPGDAFLNAFFSINEGNRYYDFNDKVSRAESERDILDAISGYHLAISAYMTEDALLSVEQNRFLMMIDQECLRMSEKWTISEKKVSEASIPDNYIYEITVIGNDNSVSFTGSYEIDDEGRICSFYIKKEI